jgi:hypothetical protein
MGKLLVTSIAVLLMTTGAAHAQEPEPEEHWTLASRFCLLEKTFFKSDKVHVSDSTDRVMIGLDSEDIAEIEKGLKELRKCNAFRQCIEKRDWPMLSEDMRKDISDPLKPGEKRPKHCYENDPRWR